MVGVYDGVGWVVHGFWILISCDVDGGMFVLIVCVLYIDIVVKFGVFGWW